MATSKSKSPTKERRPSLSEATRRRTATQVLKRLAATNPDPHTELYYRTPFQLLASVMLSAQTTDKMVNASMRDAYDAGFGPDDALALGEGGLKNLIRRIGLAPTKAKRLLAVARTIAQNGGAIPRSRDELEALPGVGRKTANVVLAELYGEKTLAVDTHVFRVTQRLGWHAENTAEKCELVLLSMIDPDLLPMAHHWLILHGRYVCKARNPACDRCPVASLCPSRGRCGTTGEASVTAPTAKAARGTRARPRRSGANPVKVATRATR